MRLLRGVLGAAAVVVFVLAVAACGGYGGDDNGEEGGSTTIGGMSAELHGTKDVSGETGKVEIELYDDYFEPTILKGEPGQTVTLELKNEGNNPHTLTISDKGVDQEVQPGDEAEADVTFPPSGQLVFVCKFHESNGMVGALEVSGSSSSTTTGETSTSESDY
ncbi:MAG TPA: cupredoxin domain-containing protein [Gaiellaceae bacterium]|nr:cupredoxin domain-containing protein [Gaiellaceae bacterium]